jgi:hypothetical protein
MTYLYFLILFICFSLYVLYSFIILSKININFGGKIGKIIRKQYWNAWYDLYCKNVKELEALKVDKDSRCYELQKIKLNEEIANKEEFIKYLKENELKI